MIFGMTHEQYEAYLAAAQAINIRYQAVQAQRQQDRTDPYDTLGPHELVRLYRDLGWWDPSVGEAEFWDRVTEWRSAQSESPSADESPRSPSASGSSPSVPEQGSSSPAVPPGGVDPDWVLG